MTTFEKITHAILIAVCLVCIGFVVKKRFFRSHAQTQHAVLEQSNEPISLPSVDWSKGRINVVLLLNDHCPFCQQSIPFYQVMESHRASDKTLKLYVASQQPRTTIDGYLRKNQLTTDGYLYVPHGFGGPVVSTPTLLLVDEKGTVLKKYVGLLDSSQQADVMNSMGRVPHS